MKGIFKALICLAASVAALLLAAFGLEFLLPPVAALAAFMAAEWGFYYLLPVLLGVVLGCCSQSVGFVSGSLNIAFTPGALCHTAAFAIYTAASALFLKRRIKHRWAVLALTVILCAGLYLRLTIGSMLEGKAPAAGVVNYLYEADEELARMLGSAYDQSMSEAISSMIGVIPDTLLMICLIAAEAMALATVLLERVWYKVFRVAAPAMARFSDWRLPSSILLGTSLMSGVCVLAFILKLDIAPALAWTIGAALVSIYSVQGLAYLMFVYEHSKAPAFVRAATWVGAFLLLPYSALFLTFMGFVEQISKKRRVIAEYEKQMNAERKRRSRIDEYEIYGYVREDRPKTAEDGRAEGEEGGHEDDKVN